MTQLSCERHRVSCLSRRNRCSGAILAERMALTPRESHRERLVPSGVSSEVGRFTLKRIPDYFVPEAGTIPIHDLIRLRSKIMKFTGNAHKYGRDIDTDVIIPARYLNTSDPAELAKHCMEDLDGGFVDKVASGDILVADENFGCGSSREHAPISIKSAGVSVIIAKSFARIFYRNAINTGLPIMEAPEAVDGITDGDRVTVDADSGVIVNETSGETYQAQPFPPFVKDIIEKGGLIAAVREKVGS